MGYPIFDDWEKKIGVINISINLKWFDEFAEEASLPPGSTLTVFDKNQTVLAHYPEADLWVGKKLPEGSVENQMVSLGQGTLRNAGLDDIDRLYAFMPLSGSEESVFISVGIPASYVFSEV